MYRVGLIALVALLIVFAVKAQVFLVVAGGGAGTSYTLLDFDTEGLGVSGGEVMRSGTMGDGGWTDNFNVGDVVTTVGAKNTCESSAGGPCADGVRDPCTWAIAEGEGVGGTDALAITAGSSDVGICAFWVARYEVGALGVKTNPDDCQQYLIGCDNATAVVNTLEFDIRYPSGFEDSDDCFPHHLGTYACEAGDEASCAGSGAESDNQHWYHQHCVSHVTAGVDWVHLVFNMQPTHQRNRTNYIDPNSPSLGGNYYNQMTRFYYEPCIQSCDPEISYPYTVYVDNVRVTYRVESIPVVVDIQGKSRGEEITDPTNYTVTFTNGTGGEVCGLVMTDVHQGSASLSGGDGARCFAAGETEDTVTFTPGNMSFRRALVSFIPDVVYNNPAGDYFNTSGMTPSGAPYGQHHGGGYDDRRAVDTNIPTAYKSGDKIGYGPNDARGLSSDFVMVKSST